MKHSHKSQSLILSVRGFLYLEENFFQEEPRSRGHVHRSGNSRRFQESVERSSSHVIRSGFQKSHTAISWKVTVMQDKRGLND